MRSDSKYRHRGGRPCPKPSFFRWIESVDLALFSAVPTETSDRQHCAMAAAGNYDHRRVPKLTDEAIWEMWKDSFIKQWDNPVKLEPIYHEWKQVVANARNFCRIMGRSTLTSRLDDEMFSRKANQLSNNRRFICRVSTALTRGCGATSIVQ